MDSKKFAEMIPAQTMLNENSNLAGQLVQINCNMHWLRVTDDQTTAFKFHEFLFYNAKTPPQETAAFPIDNQIFLLRKISVYHNPKPAGPPLNPKWLFGLSVDFMNMKWEENSLYSISNYGYVLDVMANDVFCTFYLTSKDFKFLT